MASGKPARCKVSCYVSPKPTPQKLTIFRMGYQKKGYTSGEIGAAWLKDWDKLTNMKNNDVHQYRLLLVDGHSSHFTLLFLEYARENKIVVVCYPSHSTHIYQGLDVVIFSVLKRTWSEERDAFERTGSAVSKTNFLAVYAKAHARAFTKENILSAFRKTGVVPFNPDVVTEAMMAPSLETSTSSLLPLQLASPVREVVDLISQHLAHKRRWNDMENEDLPPDAASTPAQTLPRRSNPGSSKEDEYTPVRRGMNALSSTSASFLVSDLPLASQLHLPPLHTVTISPEMCRYDSLMGQEPKTQRERDLAEALEKSQCVVALQKDVMVGMQAQTVLHSMYVEGLRQQLQGKEDKEKKSKITGRINTDGHAKIITQDQF